MKIAKQRVLFVVPSLGTGGAEKQTVNLANGLVARDAHVAIYRYRPDGMYESMVDDRVERFGYGVKIKSSTMQTVLSLWHLRNFIREFRPSIVVTTLNHVSIATWIATLGLQGIQRFICIQNNFQTSSIYWKGTGITTLYRYLFKRATRSAVGIIFICKGVLVGFEKVLGTPTIPTTVIYNVLEISSSSENDRLPIGDSTPIILACGRLHPQKDYLTLLKAFKILRKSVKVRLKILGDGPSRKELEKLAKSLGINSDLEFLGFVRDPTLHMRSATIFILTSRYEGFGNVIVEAMSVGLPVVSTDCPYGPSEIITHAHNGLLVRVGDVEGVKDALAMVLSDDVLRMRLSLNGKVRSRDFLPERILPMFVSFLENATEQDALRSTGGPS